MWKTLSIIAGLTLLAAAGISFTQLKPALTAERTQAANAATYLEKAEATLAAARQAEKDRQGLLESTKDKLTAAERAKAEAAAKKDEVAREYDLQASTRDALANEMEELESRLAELGGLNTLIQELKAEQARHAEYESQIAAKKAAVSAAQATAAAALKRTTELQRLYQNQQSGTIEPGFQSRVTSVAPEWGFFKIAAGNNRRVVHQGRLDVVRNGVLIARGVVTDVGPTTASVDIVPGSLAPGESILPGDTVVVSQTARVSEVPSSAQPKKPAAGTTPADADKPASDAAAPDAEPADPFGAPSGDTIPAPADDSAAPAVVEPVDTAEPVEPEPN